MGIKKRFASICKSFSRWTQPKTPSLKNDLNQCDSSSHPEPVTLNVRGKEIQAAIHSLRVSATESIRICLVDRTGVDPIADSIAAGTSMPLDIFQLLPELISPGARVIDLGTHIGTFSLYSAWLGYEVLAIEASPLNCALLRESIRANGFNNITVVENAATDRETTLSFVDDGPYGRLISNSGSEDGLVSVEAKRVSTILSEVGWDRVDFIKMDIEGSEPAAVAGMQELLNRHDAPTVLFESNGHTLKLLGYTPEDLTKQFDELGFQLYLTEHGKLRPFSFDEPQGILVVDYLASKSPLKTKSWPVIAPLTQLEHQLRILQSLNSDHPLEPQWAIDVLNRSPQWLSQHPKIQEDLKMRENKKSSKVA